MRMAARRIVFLSFVAGGLGAELLGTRGRPNP
jgi:hypothetical protein